MHPPFIRALLFFRSVSSSASRNGVLTTITGSAARSTETHSGPASGGFFSNRSTVAGTFALVGVEVVVLFFAIFLCRRRHRKKQIRSLVGRMHLLQNHTQTNPFSAGSFEDHNPHGPPSLNGSRHDRAKKNPDSVEGDHTENGLATQGSVKQQYYEDEDIYHETKYPPLARATPGPFMNHRFWDGDASLHHHPYRTALQPPPYSRDTTTVNHSPAITQSRAYFPFRSWRPLSQVPSSSSTYPPILSVAEEDVSVYELPTSMVISSPKTTVLPLQNNGRRASATRLSSYEALVNPGIYAMTSLHQEDSQGYTPVSPMRPSLHAPSPSYPPPIPPKSPLRRVMSTRDTLDDSCNKTER